MARQLHLVGHTSWNRQTNEPTPEAATQAMNILDRLSGVLGESAIILASRARRTMFLARLLSGGSGTPFYESARLEIGGNHPSGIQNFDTFIGRTLEEVGIDLDTNASLVVVTPQPLLKLATGIDEIEPGAVIPYDTSSWHNRHYHTLFEQDLERQIANALASQSS